MSSADSKRQRLSEDASAQADSDGSSGYQSDRPVGAPFDMRLKELERDAAWFDKTAQRGKALFEMCRLEPADGNAGDFLDQTCDQFLNASWTAEFFTELSDALTDRRVQGKFANWFHGWCVDITIDRNVVNGSLFGDVTLESMFFLLLRSFKCTDQVASKALEIKGLLDAHRDIDSNQPSNYHEVYPWKTLALEFFETLGSDPFIDAHPVPSSD